jgi:uncharacterized protein YfcZ (UPF0381/DUF406 family)
MVEKKIATIAILCVATILFMGLWSNSAQEARTLNSKYVKVVEDYNRLTTDYSNLEAEKASLEKDYSKLTSDYSNLEAEKASLEKDYSKLKTFLDGAKAIVESAEWVSEDGRLKVTSELIVVSYQYFGMVVIVSYTIRVNVTNIGTEPIDKVVILIFPYKAGKFAETYSEYKSHSVENLYIGETDSHDFTSITKDMTNYKVLAVAG